MSRPAGLPKTGGRKAGTPNKTTQVLKEAILAAAEAANEDGTVGYLTWLAKNNSSAFASLLGKVLPMTLVGDSDNPIEHRHEDNTARELIASRIVSLASRVGPTTSTERLN